MYGTYLDVRYTHLELHLGDVRTHLLGRDVAARVGVHLREGYMG